MNGYGMNGWGFEMGFGWLIPLLFIAAIVYFFMNNKQKAGRSARDILDEKYANGEIDEQEYNRMRDELNK
ncbi:MAG: SHOCT domain-containing protein [Helicobacteraceae bacterium]|jgi:putative membrane protein|nr:SHOCT domain-containing protein [Helicobacteraceae bacterium]